jgi:hypothetical protein
MFSGNVEQILSLIKPCDLVLDIGGWAQPFRRANFVMDAMPFETRGFYAKIGLPDHMGNSEEQFSEKSWIQRDICAREPYPFADKSIDFVICSHVLEDIRDPLWVCSEMIRIGKRGYIEVPSRIMESIVDNRLKIVGASHHRWLVSIEQSKIIFEMKYHLIHKKGLHLPAYTMGTLKPEQQFQWLFWEDSFEFEEAEIPLGEEEVERRLKRFVQAQRIDVNVLYRLFWGVKPFLKTILQKLPARLAVRLERIGKEFASWLKPSSDRNI